MAEVYITGITGGDVALPSGHAMKVRGGSLRLFQTPIDTSNTGGGGNQSRRGGLRGASGTAVGFPTYNTTSTSPGWTTIASGADSVPANMTYTVATGCTYAFQGLVTNIEHGFDVRGEATTTFTFESDGAITETWDVT